MKKNSLMKSLDSDVLSKNWENLKHQLKGVLLMDSHEHSYRWQQLPSDTDKPFPALRNKHATCVSNGALYVYGGRDKSMVYSDLWRYKLDDGIWERLICKGEKPRLLQEHTLIAHKNKLYLFGGQFAAGTENETPLWILDLETLTWRKHRPDSEVMTPAGRRGHTVVTNGNQMVIYGGYLDVRGSSGELWMFDMDLEMWHLAHSILNEGGPGGRHGHSAVVFANSMWVVGGMCDLAALCDMWKWDFSVRKWSRVRCKNSPPEVHGHSACVLNNDMLVVGGESQWNLQDTVWQFSFKNLTWHKLKFDGPCPSPRSHHTCIAVPTFLLKSSSDHNTSRSEPSLRGNDITDASKTARPNTSPADPNSQRNQGVHVFKNKINPAALRGRRSVEEGLRHLTPENTQISDTSCMRLALVNSSCECLIDESESNDVLSVEQLSTPETWYDELREIGPIRSVTEFRSGGSTECSTEGQVTRSRTRSGGAENPVFSREVSVEHPSRPKRLRPWYDFSGSTANQSISTEALLNSASNDTLEQIPGVVKSGSLDSLLRDLGGVDITYTQIDNNNCEKETVPVNNNTVIVEDIENCDLLQLERSHNHTPSRSQRFAKCTSGGFESSRDRLLSSDSGDLVELSDFNRGDGRTGDGLHDDDIRRFASGFMTMDDGLNCDAPMFELMSLDTNVMPQRRTNGSNGHNNANGRGPTTQRHFPSGHHETVADVTERPAGMTIILCGGREANRSTCELQPMPVWRLDIVKT